MKRSIKAGMLERQRAGEAGNLAHSDETVREFRRRVAAGESQRGAGRALGISPASANQIARNLSYRHVLPLLMLMLVTMGNSCVGRNSYNVTCQGINYPLCRNVPSSYPCLCLESPSGVSATQAEDMRHLNDR